MKTFKIILLLCLFPFALLATESLKLTPKEQAYIKAHPVIKIDNEMDFPPFDFNVDQKPLGYSIELLNLIAERAGFKIEYVYGYTWNQMIEMFKQRKIDLLHTLNKTAEREKFGIYSEPFHTYKTVFATRKENPDITELSQLYGKVVAVGNGWATEAFLAKNYPQIKLLKVDTIEQMLKAVSKNEAYATFEMNNAMMFAIRKNWLTNMKLTGWAKEFDKNEPQHYYFLAQKDAPELISILNKGVSTLSSEDKKLLSHKWLGTSD